MIARSAARAALAALLVAAISGCRGDPAPARGERIVVFASIIPLEFVAERIGSGKVEVEVLVGPGRNPITYEPTPRQMAALSEARLLLRAGVPFENSLVPRIAGMHPGEGWIADVREGVGTDDADPTDPHLWMDPERMRGIARNAARAMSGAAPHLSGPFEEGLEDLLADLDALDARIAERLAPVRGGHLFVYHGAYRYFCERYGLVQVPLSAGGKEPSGKDLARFVDLARRHRARALFVQPQFSSRQAKTVSREIGAEVIELDPLAGDYLANMRAVAEEVARALSPAIDTGDEGGGR